MTKEAFEKKEDALNAQLKQVAWEQEVQERELRKQERKMDEFLEMSAAEQQFFQEFLGLQLDDQTQDFFQQSTQDADWLSREELEYLEYDREGLLKNQKNLVEKEEELLIQRKQLFMNEGSPPAWD